MPDLITASIFSRFWNDQLVAHHRQGLFLVLAGFLASFGFIRMSTRLIRSPRVSWWPGSVVSDSGVHLHHLVWGISLMIGAGALGFTQFGSPWFEICAALFGVGVGLTIDEFALWIYLKDVYWAEEGRASVDAAVIAVVAMGLVLVGVRPFDISTGTVADALVSIVVAVLILLLVMVCFLKQRLLHGIVGFFIWPVALYATARIGKPHSPWAKRRYGERNPAKQRRSEDRFRPDRRTERFKRSFRDAVGGSPEPEYEAKLAERDREATRQAAEAVQERAKPAAEPESKLPSG